MSDDQFTQLTQAIQAIDGRFDIIDDRFDAVDKKFDAISRRFDATDHQINAIEKSFDDQFTGLFRYVEDRFQTIEERLEQTVTKSDFDRVMNAVDALAKQTETYHHEMLALGHQVDRHEQWIVKAGA